MLILVSIFNNIEHFVCNYQATMVHVIYEAICFMFTLCYFVLVFFSPFGIAITLLGEEIANLSAFRTFVRFALVWFCPFLVSGKGCG